MVLTNEQLHMLNFSNVNPLKPIEVIAFLKAINKPFIEEEYKRIIASVLSHGGDLSHVVKRYLLVMNLAAYRNMEFEDSYYDDTNIVEKFYCITVKEDIDYYGLNK